jgi:hypothetical protein
MLGDSSDAELSGLGVDVLLNGGARWRPERPDQRIRVEIADDLNEAGAAKAQGLLSWPAARFSWNSTTTISSRRRAWRRSARTSVTPRPRAGVPQGGLRKGRRVLRHLYGPGRPAYIEANALAWSHRRGLLALDLGAAHRKLINDFHRLPAPGNEYRTFCFPTEWHSTKNISYVVANLIAMKEVAGRCGRPLLVQRSSTPWMQKALCATGQVSQGAISRSPDVSCVHSRRRRDG